MVLFLSVMMACSSGTSSTSETSDDTIEFGVVDIVNEFTFSVETTTPNAGEYVNVHIDAPDTATYEFLFSSERVTGSGMITFREEDSLGYAETSVDGGFDLDEKSFTQSAEFLLRFETEGAVFDVDLSVQTADEELLATMSYTFTAQ